jgi:methyl-accepting chemotaxis protein
MNQLYQLPANMVIISRSDLQGNIISFNAGFEEASGYSTSELNGKPHSILRHPDMPKEAFQDMWQTLKSGHAWHGMVKNKRKNGDYYWVFANASPVIEQDRIVGYVSVRYPASTQQIQQAEALYADIRSARTQMPWTKQDRKTRLLTGIAAVLALMPVVALLSGVEQIGLVAASIVLGVGATAFNWYQAQTFFQPNRAQQQAIQALTRGDFHTPVQGDSPWSDALNVIRTRIAEYAALQYDSAKVALRLTAALQAASTNIMVADNAFNIISINATLAKMFQRNEQGFRQAIPNFRADRIVGSSMDIFHRNPEHQRHFVEQLTQPFDTELSLSGLIIRLIVKDKNMVMSSSGLIVPIRRTLWMISSAWRVVFVLVISICGCKQKLRSSIITILKMS